MPNLRISIKSFVRTSGEKCGREGRSMRAGAGSKIEEISFSLSKWEAVVINQGATSVGQLSLSLAVGSESSPE
jgi:hypothetical protein